MTRIGCIDRGLPRRRRLRSSQPADRALHHIAITGGWIESGQGAEAAGDAGLLWPPMRWPTWLPAVGEDYGEGSSIMQERSHAFAMKSQVWPLRAAVFALGTALQVMVREARPRWRIRMPGDAYRRCTPRESAIGLVDIEAGGDEFALATRWERWQPLVAASAMRRATDPQLAHCANRTRP